jgi:hypothetical protein
MKNWHDVTIDLSDVDEIERLVLEYEGYNSACNLIDYWKKRMYYKMMPELKQNNKLVYGFVGDGWPIKSDQTSALRYDKLKLRNAFDDINYRDVGDAIYQANKIISMIPSTQEKIYIMDIGSGYGRLAVPFLHHFKDRICYIGVDYSVMGLLVSPQFISQTTDVKVRYYNNDTNIEDFQYVSLPAWKLKDIEHIRFNTFITIHSFQEMSIESINFYVNFAKNHAVNGSIFYSVNLPPEYKLDWKLLSNAAYPINRDGSYNEKIYIRK